MNDGTSENALREEVRSIADALLVDVHITFIAMMKERGYATDARAGTILLDEWASSLLQSAQSVRESLEAFRANPSTASALDSIIDDEIGSAIDERRAAIRELDHHDDERQPPLPL